MNDRRQNRRRAMVLVVMLCALVVATVVFATTVRLAVAQRRLIEVQGWQAQAAWLARSALERAVARLATEPAYVGETWHIAAGELGGDAAVVTIAVKPAPDQPGRRMLRAEAIYPNRPEQRAQNTVDVFLDIDQGSKP